MQLPDACMALKKQFRGTVKGVQKLKRHMNAYNHLMLLLRQSEAQVSIKSLAEIKIILLVAALHPSRWGYKKDTY